MSDLQGASCSPAFWRWPHTNDSDPLGLFAAQKIQAAPPTSSVSEGLRANNFVAPDFGTSASGLLMLTSALATFCLMRPALAARIKVADLKSAGIQAVATWSLCIGNADRNVLQNLDNFHFCHDKKLKS